MTKDEKVVWDRWKQSKSEHSPEFADLLKRDPDKAVDNVGIGEPPKRVIVSVFDSMEKAQAWRDSAAWKDLTPLRVKAVKTRAYIAEGVAN